MPNKKHICFRGGDEERWGTNRIGEKIGERRRYEKRGLPKDQYGGGTDIFSSNLSVFCYNSRLSPSFFRVAALSLSLSLARARARIP